MNSIQSMEKDSLASVDTCVDEDASGAVTLHPASMQEREVAESNQECVDSDNSCDRWLR